VKLEEQGRYDEAVQTVLDERTEGLPDAGAYSEVGMIYLDRAKKIWQIARGGHNRPPLTMTKLQLRPKGPLHLGKCNGRF